ncbi:MAG: hypothetical protein ACO1SV_19610 [Fimbriimonas sp.]
MIPISALSAACAALLSPGAGAVSTASAPLLFKPQFEEPVIEPFRWSNPTAIDARPRERGVFATAGAYYGEYRGRKLEIDELQVGAAFTPNVYAWFGRQDILLKGRAQTSRFDTQADFYGIRWIVRPPREEGGASLAVEYEAVRPDTASARTNTTSATYIATKNNTLAVTAAMRGGLQGQLAYTKVEGVNGEDGNVFALVAAKDFNLSSRLAFRAQAHLVGQNIKDSIDDVDFEVKPIAFFALGYRLAKGLRLESDLTFMPSGTPLSAGRISGLTSFQIYQPGGPAAGLRSDAFAVGAIRLVGHFSF